MTNRSHSFINRPRSQRLNGAHVSQLCSSFYPLFLHGSSTISAKRGTTADPSHRNKGLLIAPPAPPRSGPATRSKSPIMQSQRPAPTVETPQSFRGLSTVEGSAEWWYGTTCVAKIDATSTARNRVGTL